MAGVAGSAVGAAAVAAPGCGPRAAGRRAGWRRRPCSSSATAIGVVSLLNPPPGDEFRASPAFVVESLVPADAALPRDAFRLRWTPGPEGSRYQVRVTTEDLQVLATAADLTAPEFVGRACRAFAAARWSQRALAGGRVAPERRTGHVSNVRHPGGVRGTADDVLSWSGRTFPPCREERRPCSKPSP